MKTKIVKLQEAVKFIKQNGYFIAVYKRQGNKYVKYNDNYTIDDTDMERDIIVEVVGCGIDFREFESVDKQYFFVLHNNFNIPMTMPIFEKV